MGRRPPPNLLVCSGCGHEWTGGGWGKCPNCDSDKVTVRCGAKRRAVKCSKCKAEVRRVEYEEAGGCPSCGEIIETDLLCRKFVKRSVGGRCKRHGRDSPVGPASGTWIDGRASVLPSRYAKAFEQSLSDPHQLSLGRDLALLDARRAELLGRFATGESGEAWAGVRDAYAALVDGIDGRDRSAQRRAVEALGKAIQDGEADEKLWADLSMLLEERRQTVKVESGRIAAQKDSVPADMVMAMVYGIINSGRGFINATADSILVELGVELDGETKERLLNAAYVRFAQELRELVSSTHGRVPGLN